MTAAPRAAPESRAEHERPAMNCDRIARGYRWLEYAAFGRALERRREAFLEEVCGARRVLVLGDGDGRALVKLLAAAPGARVDYVDLSGAMTELARKRAGRAGKAEGRGSSGNGEGAAPARVAFRCGDALTIPFPEAEYDLIVTHFFLDCLDEAGIESLAARVEKAARPDARWIVSEFREPGRWARYLVRGLYLFFRVTTKLRTGRLVDHRPCLARHGFRPVRITPALAGLLASELWSR